MSEPKEERVNDADQALREALDRWPKIARLADRLKKLREENHFGELIEEGLWGKRHGA